MLLVSRFSPYLLLVAPVVWAQACPPNSTPVPTSPVQIRYIAFTNASLLSAEKQNEISSKLREEAISAIDGPAGSATVADEDQGATNLADQAAGRVSAAYQNEGYFKTEVSARAIKTSPDNRRYDLIVRVDDAGPQYRLGNLDIIKAQYFPAQQLRDLFPIQPGDIFSREKITKGLEDLRALYGSHGYMNTTPVPKADFDDSGIANLTIDVDEGKQFRFRSVDVVGTNPATKALVLSQLQMQPGDFYNPKWEQSVKSLSSAVDVERKLDEREGWVDVVLHLSKPRPCFVGSVLLSPR